MSINCTLLHLKITNFTTNLGPLSELMADNRIEKTFLKHEITVKADMSKQGKVKGNLKYSSTATRYFFFEHKGLGSSKSMEIISKDYVEWISLA